MRIGREDAIGRIGPEALAILQECFAAAWRQYEEEIAQRHPLFGARAMANAVHEFVKEQVRHRFDGFAGVQVVDRQRFLLVFKSGLVLQFRKLSRNFRTQNNPTRTSLAFDRQQPTPLLVEVSELPRVTVGYQLGQYNTMIAGIWLVFLVGKTAVWHHDLNDNMGTTELEFPRPDIGPADEEARDAERKRRKDQEEDKSG